MINVGGIEMSTRVLFCIIVVLLCVSCAKVPPQFEVEFEDCCEVDSEEICAEVMAELITCFEDVVIWREMAENCVDKKIGIQR